MVLAVILFQGFIFIGLVLLLRQFMKGHVTGAVGHLQKMNDELMKQQAELKDKIATGEKEYETKMTKLQQDILARQNLSRQEATKILEEARERSLQEREKLIHEAIDTREKMRQEIMAEMEGRAILYSKDLIAEFFSGEIRQLAHSVLVRDVIEGIRETQMDHFQIQSDTADLIAAGPIEAALKQEILKILQEKIKKEIHFKEQTDPSLIGGLVLRFGTFVIDGSLANRLEKAAARLRKESVRRYQGKV